MKYLNSIFKSIKKNMKITFLILILLFFIIYFLFNQNIIEKFEGRLMTEVLYDHGLWDDDDGHNKMNIEIPRQSQN